MKSLIIITIFFTYLKANTQIISETKDHKKDKKSTKLALVIGGNYTYVPDTETINGINYDSRYSENTFAINFAIDIGKHIRLGFDYKRIHTSGVWSGKNQYAMIGAFTQYKFAEGKRGFGFGELGYYKGNYCTCGENVPYKKEGVNYLSWGGGYNHKLFKNIRLDLAFTTAQVISKITDRYGYTQYIIGLDYIIPFLNR